MVNFATTGANRGFVALPTQALQGKYPSSTSVDALFTTAANTVRMDGFANLQILGMQQDYTQTTSSELL